MNTRRREKLDHHQFIFQKKITKHKKLDELIYVFQVQNGFKVITNCSSYSLEFS